jgi:hypothetical protein
MKRLPPDVYQVLEEWRATPWRGKRDVLDRHLARLGISEGAFYALARRWGYLEERATRRDRGRLSDPRRREWVREIMALKHAPPPGVRALTTEDARRLVARGKNDPEEARAILALPVGSINRLARELGLVERPRREARMEAARPNQVHQMDASFSEHFFPFRREGEEWLLKLRPRRSKNKEKLERLRVICYGLCDDFSGYRLARYTVAAGESGLDSIRFLQWCWEANPEHAPFRGWPEVLYLDNGPVAKLAVFRRFCGSLGVEVKTHEPYRSQATGKVENNWRVAWSRFENVYFADPGWESRVITLTELNQEFARFWREWNQRGHRRLQLSREEAWLLINRQGGPVSVAPEAWRRLAVQRERTLDAAGCFDLEGYTYQVKELWSCRVTVFRGLLDGAVWVQEEEGARRRFRAEPFQPQVWGEYRGSPKSELERLREGWSPEASPERPVFFADPESNVVHLVRPGEVRGREPEGAEPEAPAPGATRRYATPLERYGALKLRALRGEGLAPEEAEFISRVEAEYAEEVALLVEGLRSRARLGQ